MYSYYNYSTGRWPLWSKDITLWNLFVLYEWNWLSLGNVSSHCKPFHVTQAASDKEANVEGAVEIPATDANQADIVKACIDNVLAQMDADRKLTSLKQLQGHMWREAYKTGKVAGE